MAWSYDLETDKFSLDILDENSFYIGKLSFKDYRREDRPYEISLNFFYTFMDFLITEILNYRGSNDITKNVIPILRANGSFYQSQKKGELIKNFRDFPGHI